MVSDQVERVAAAAQRLHAHGQGVGNADEARDALTVASHLDRRDHDRHEPQVEPRPQHEGQGAADPWPLFEGRLDQAEHVRQAQGGLHPDHRREDEREHVAMTGALAQPGERVGPQLRRVPQRPPCCPEEADREDGRTGEDRTS